jgi:hypothetical protein
MPGRTRVPAAPGWLHPGRRPFAAGSPRTGWIAFAGMSAALVALAEPGLMQGRVEAAPGVGGDDDAPDTPAPWREAVDGFSERSDGAILARGGGISSFVHRVEGTPVQSLFESSPTGDHVFNESNVLPPGWSVSQLFAGPTPDDLEVVSSCGL